MTARSWGTCSGTSDGRLHADSAYRSAKIDEELRRRNIQNHLHEKGCRNRPLTEQQKASNTRKSRVRANRIRTIGKPRAERGIGLGNLVYNCFRYVQLGGSMA